jgi:integrase
VLADAIGPQYQVLVYFLAYTGLRFGEVVALRVKRLDLLRAAARWSSRRPRWAARWYGADQDR